MYKARYPTLRAAEALILVAAMFLAIFAMVYVMISLRHRPPSPRRSTRFSAYYYSLTVLATVGFGDIAPNTVARRARSTMVQMALDIAFIAVLIRVMGGAATKAPSCGASSSSRTDRRRRRPSCPGGVGMTALPRQVRDRALEDPSGFWLRGGSRIDWVQELRPSASTSRRRPCTAGSPTAC